MQKTASLKNVLLGAHISTAGGAYKAIERGESIGCNAIQIFTKSNKTWSAKPLASEDIALFKKASASSSISHIMAHAGYLINIASSNEKIFSQSLESLAQELMRCEQLAIPYLILHPGSHVGEGEEKGIQNIAIALNIVLKDVPGKCMILLETMAGQGTSIGHTFENLKSIYNACNHKKRIGFCIDTCHIFAAGYDLSTPQSYKDTLDQFNRIVGIKHLKAIHLNDSKGILGCKKDRHQTIGKGLIPLPVFKLLMNDARLVHVPKILETPVNNFKEYDEELRLLKGFLKKN